MTHDVIIIGGSYAGLAAALQLARARRRVLVIDAGERRNRFASHAHGFLSRDGTPPGEIAAIGRAQLVAYPTVQWLEARATSARRTGDDGFEVTADGATHAGRRIVLALGVVDELPDLPGLAERWGRTAFHCPYCHGYELGGGPIATLATQPTSHHIAMMLPDWGPTTFFLQGQTLEPDVRAALERRGVAIEETRVLAVSGEERVTLRLADDRAPTFAGLHLLPSTRPASPLAAELGCALEDGPLGQLITTDAVKRTTVPGVFACGDAALAMGSVSFAIADGARAGASAHQSLVFP